MRSWLCALVASVAPVSVTGQIDPSIIIESGKDIWQAIKDNQPTIDITTDWGGAIPKGLDDWTVLENWQGPTRSPHFKIEFKNGVGMTLTRFAWNFVYKHHGSYNGTGRYVTQAGIEISDSFAELSEHLDVQVKALKAINYGTHENPLAGLDVLVQVSSHGLFEKTTKQCVMTMKGDGTTDLGDCETGTFTLVPKKTANIIEAAGRIDPSEIWQIGKAIWQAIEDNQPTINITTDWGGAIPKDVSDWTLLENWQGPTRSQDFKVEFRNGLGMTLTRFAWNFVFKHHGSYQGTGKYVTEVGIEVSDSFAELSEHLDVQIKAMEAVNYGTHANPIGGIDILVQVSSHGLFERTSKQCRMTMKGDGTTDLGECQTGTFTLEPAKPPVAPVQEKIDPADIWQIGEAIYQAIKDNQPTIDVKTDWAGAVPRNISDWTLLENWQGPTRSQSFYIEFKNHLGTKLTRFDWNFVWKHHGTYNGAGLYVTEAGIEVGNSYALLSEHLNVIVTNLQAVNYGTKEHPIGGLDVTISLSSHGLFEKTTKECTMTMKGDGSFSLGTCESGTFPCAAINGTAEFVVV